MEERVQSRSNAVWKLSLVLGFTWITFILISITLLWSMYAVRQELLSHLSRLENAGVNMACDCLRIQEHCCTEGKSSRVGYQENLQKALTLTQGSGNDAKKFTALKSGKDARNAEGLNVQASGVDNSVNDISAHFRHIKRRETGFPRNESSKVPENQDVKVAVSKSSEQQTQGYAETKKRQGDKVIIKDDSKGHMVKLTGRGKEQSKTNSNNFHVGGDMSLPKHSSTTVGLDSTKSTKMDTQADYLKTERDLGRNNRGEKALNVDVEQGTSLSGSDQKDAGDDLEGGMGSGCDECGLNLRTYIKNVVKDTQMSMTKATPKASSSWLPTCRCRNVTTDWNTTYNIGISKFLESHTIKCSDNEFLQSIVFRGNRDEFFPLYRYEFRCCRILNTHE